MEKYKVTGMSCAACSARVEKAVSGLEGVDVCSVNLLTSSMTVEGSVSAETVIAAVEAAGYGASLETGKKEVSAKEKSGAEKEEKNLIARLVASVAILAVLMYVSMGYAMWGWPLPNVIARNPMTVALIQMILSASVMIINQKFFVNGARGLWHRAPNMDTLVALGSGASFGYSTYAVFKIGDMLLAGDISGAEHMLHGLYFESAAMILALITVGKMLEARAKGKTTDALEALMKLSPQTATVIRDGKETVISIENVVKGDVFIVRPGENIPVDGEVTDGRSAVDESDLTGESLPIDKKKGDKVSSGTNNKSGALTCRATRVGEDTTLSQIIKMVSDASATKAPIAKIADKVSGVFVPIVITVAVITTAIWLIAGEAVGVALSHGIAVLVISCPCALGLATPVAIMVGTGLGAKNGILFKTAASLEETGRVKTVLLDKTGTITKGHPSVTDVVPHKSSNTELLKLAASLERNSEHPLSEAVRKKAEELGIKAVEVKELEVVPGKGLLGKIDDRLIVGGNLDFVREYAKISEDIIMRSDGFAEEGKTPLYFAYDGSLIGVIAVADTVKDDSADAIAELRAMGIKTVMLTGDNAKTANAIGKAVGVDEVISGVLPDGKENVVREYMKNGKVAMVGDGINDAPALTRADIGIAIGAGTDIAIDAADVVLMKSSLADVPAAIRLSRKTLKNIHENLFWAFFYNTVGIPLAAGALVPVWGISLTPMFGAAAMSLSSFCVVTNALRLNFAKIKNKKEINEEKENEKMTKVMKIDGMMCPHCEARVKKTLESFAEVCEAVVSHEAGTAVITFTSDISNEALAAAIENDGYTVLGIE
ncbi:MAG: heavy metal translocating P-type ATPase [Clostridia bacterium]|nr:heavy metal translocating P-type ATPase [Clostridia bacterium]